MIAIHRDRLLDRFLRYVRVSSPADPNSGTYPSSPGQLELGRILVGELKAIGILDAHQDSHGLVWGLIPATLNGNLPTVLLNAHLDTSPEAPSQGIRPQVVDDYGGGDIVLGNSGQAITAKHCPQLDGLRGKTLITTDGRTLLGGDDKAGVAIIMELALTLVENPQLPHGPVQILFTCDEEIGHGTQYVDLEKIGARVGYTIDGGGAGEIDQETFSADRATVKFTGHNIHPALGKNRMINALRGAGKFLASLPCDRLSPETTDDRQGFLHPYEISGGVGAATLQLILRDFETQKLTEYASFLTEMARKVESEIPGLKIEVETQRQYRNMADGLRRMPLAVELAENAFKQLNRPCERCIVRGGTDGALLTEMGLPTPNLSSGQYNIHSVLEFACLDQMIESAEHLIVLLDLWQKQGRS